MNSKRRILILLAVGLTLVATSLLPAAAAPPAPPAPGRLSVSPLTRTGTLEVDKAGTRTSYLIRLADPPLAAYRGGVAGLKPTSPRATGQAKLDARTADSQAYLNHLAAQQARFRTELAQISPAARVLHSYRVTYNGVSALLTADEAAKVARLPGVVSVHRDTLQKVQTDVSPGFIGATKVWDGTAAGLPFGSAFEAMLSHANEVPPVATEATGRATFTYDPATRQLNYEVRVSNIISITLSHIHRGAAGVNGPVAYPLYLGQGEFGPGKPISGTVTVSESDAALLTTGGLYVNVHTVAHPAGEMRGQIMPLGNKGEGVIVGVVDTGIWPEHPSFADDGTYPPPPAYWSGTCVAPASDHYTCNNKLIGIQYFLDTYAALNPGGYDGLFLSGRDDDGHGTHTASTAAGNENVQAMLLGVTRGLISGMAPRAHVAAYKGLGPGGGYTSDLLAAIEQAVSDGVDVINYSIGGSASDPYTDDGSLVFLNAREAGVFVATAAGNDGPNPDTIDSPGNAPWITTAGASTSSRYFLSDITVTGPGTPPTGLWGTSVTDGIADFNLVDATGIPDSQGENSGRCLNAFKPGTFQPTDVVLCRRGVVARVLRGENVKAGGGGAVILANPVDNQDLDTDNFVIPGVHVTKAFGDQLAAYVAQHPGQAKVSFTAGTSIYGPADPRVTPDMMAAFSSRGPNGFLPAVVKPDVTAPGVQILAGYSPQTVPDGSAQGQLFAAIQGTSMSSPHVAGAGALLKAVHPDWSPAALQSALMTTAKVGVVEEDGTTPATPFDAGAGRIDLTHAADPGLVFDMTAQDYLDGQGDPANMNLPSLGFGEIAGRATIHRTATSVLATDSTWTFSVAAPAKVAISISPEKLTIPAGGQASFDVTVNAGRAPIGQYFGDVYLTDGTRRVHLPVVFKTVPGEFSSLQEIKTGWDAGTAPFTMTSGIDVDPFVLRAYGLVDPVRTAGGPITQDSDQNANTDPLGEGFQVFTYTLTPDTLWFVAQTRDFQGSDLDLYLLYDANGDGKFDWDTEMIDRAIDVSADEEVGVLRPKPGLYAVAAYAYSGSGTYTLKTYLVGGGSLGHSLQVNGAPASVVAGMQYAMQVAWNQTIDEGEEYLGALTLGSQDDPTLMAVVPVRVIGITPAVRKLVDKATAELGETVTYDVVLSNTDPQPRDMQLVDTVPSGLVVDPASISGGATLANGVISWSGSLPAAADQVVIGPSSFPFGYVSLASLGVSPISGVCTACDDTAVNFTVDPVFYLGDQYDTICMTTNGYVVMGGCSSSSDISATPSKFPDSDPPNNVVAPLWMDYDLDGGNGVGDGTWYASRVTDGTHHWSVFEWENAQLYHQPGTAFTFQLWLEAETEQVTFTYHRFQGPRDNSVVGAENAAGTAGAMYYFNGGPSDIEGTYPTVNTLLDVSGTNGASRHRITYRASAAIIGTAANTATVTSGANRDTSAASVTVTRPPLAEMALPASAAGYVDSGSRLNGFCGGGTLWVGVDTQVAPTRTLEGVVDFDLRALPANAVLTAAQFEVTGRDTRFLNAKGGQFNARLLPTGHWCGLGYYAVSSSQPVASLSPTLIDSDLRVGTVNVFNFDASNLPLLQARAGSSASFRLEGRHSAPFGRHIMGWDGRAGNNAPALRITYYVPHAPD